jgi:hypothetical protein
MCFLAENSRGAEPDFGLFAYLAEADSFHTA